jgi:hypothetical protein
VLPPLIAGAPSTTRSWCSTDPGAEADARRDTPAKVTNIAVNETLVTTITSFTAF